MKSPGASVPLAPPAQSRPPLLAPATPRTAVKASSASDGELALMLVTFIVIAVLVLRTFWPQISLLVPQINSWVQKLLLLH